MRNDYPVSYGVAARSAFPGLVPSADYGPVFSFENIFSRRIEGAAVGFGLAVGIGSADGSAKLGGWGFEGITVADETQDTGDYQVGVTAGVLSKGNIWVTASAALARGDALYFEPASGAITSVSTGNTPIPNAKTLNTAEAGAMALLFLG